MTEAARPRPALDHELEDPSSPVVATAQVTHRIAQQTPARDRRRDLDHELEDPVARGRDGVAGRDPKH